MVDDLKQSILSQQALPLRQFTVMPGNLPADYARALEVRVTEVYGAPARISRNGRYLVCGEYSLREPIIESMVLAMRGRMEGNIQHLQPGTHAFTLYGQAQEVLPDGDTALSLLTFLDGDEYIILLVRL